MGQEGSGLLREAIDQLGRCWRVVCHLVSGKESGQVQGDLRAEGGQPLRQFPNFLRTVVLPGYQQGGYLYMAPLRSQGDGS